MELAAMFYRVHFARDGTAEIQSGEVRVLENGARQVVGRSRWEWNSAWKGSITEAIENQYDRLFARYFLMPRARSGIVDQVGAVRELEKTLDAARMTG